jgi:hypothetical protein
MKNERKTAMRNKRIKERSQEKEARERGRGMDSRRWG